MESYNPVTNFQSPWDRSKQRSMRTREVETSVIGEMVMDKLKDLNEVAYVRFAAIYREFKDVNTFMSELKKLLK